VFAACAPAPVTPFPEADLSNLGLHPAAHRAIEIEQPGGRTDKRGQFVLPVSPPAPNADALFEQAQAAEDAGDIAEAERLYRVLMNCDPGDAAPPFNLGNMFRATGRKIEAEAALRAATRRSRKLVQSFRPTGRARSLRSRNRLSAARAPGCLKAAAAPVGTPWLWTLALPPPRDRTPTHGSESTPEAAMAAFAKSWRRE
jgi:tetratricopeptide (TPR) repeat protein